MGCALAAGTMLAASVSLIFILRTRTRDSCCPPRCRVGACCPGTKCLDGTCIFDIFVMAVVQHQQSPYVAVVVVVSVLVVVVELRRCTS